MFLDALMARYSSRSLVTAVLPEMHSLQDDLRRQGIPAPAPTFRVNEIFTQLHGPAGLRLVLSRSAMDTIDETCSSRTLVAAARKSVLLPHPAVWLEWKLYGQTCGFGFRSRPGFEGIAGDGLMVVQMEDESFHIGHFAFDLRASDFIRWYKAPAVELERTEFGLEKLVTGLSALWASPRLIEVEAVEIPPRLAAARAKRKAHPLSDHSIVHLSKVATATRADSGTTTGDGTPRRGHRVRGHLRLLRSGRFVPVRPHERGDLDRPMSGTVRVVG